MAGNLIAQVAAPYTFIWSNATAGAATVFARLIYNGSSTMDSPVATIVVTNPPTVTIEFTPGVGGQNWSIQGTGLANQPYFLSMASNLAPPVSWILLQTNVAGPAGEIIFTNIVPTNAQEFFRIYAP